MSVIRAACERLEQGRHVLVGYIDRAWIDRYLESLQSLHQALGAYAQGLAIVPPGAGLPPTGSVPALADAAGNFAEHYGARPGMVWLVRPDGHLGLARPSGAADGLAAIWRDSVSRHRQHARERAVVITTASARDLLPSTPST